MWRRFLTLSEYGEKARKFRVGTPCPRLGLTSSKCVQQANNLDSSAALSKLTVKPHWISRPLTPTLSRREREFSPFSLAEKGRG